MLQQSSQNQQQMHHQQQTQQYQIQQAPVGPVGDCSPPIFEQIFKNTRFAQGGNALFEGKLKGSPKPTVTWTRRGAPLVESQKYKTSYNIATGEVSLLITQIGPGDEGEYTCCARNQYGEAICSVYIQPEGFPGPPQTTGYQKDYSKISQQSNQQQSTQQQSTQQKTVTSSRYAQPPQQQISNGRANQTNGFSQYTSALEEEFKVDTFEYRLLRETSFRESVTRRIMGEQDCQLSQNVDRNLGPASPPQVSTKARNSKLLEGSDAVFTIKVSGNPKPRLTWFKNGQRIVTSEKYEMTYSNNQATLRIRNANYTDSGNYTLLAENIQGCVVSSAILVIESVQVPPTQEIRYENDMDLSGGSGKALEPQFVRIFNDREATEGKLTRFDCRVTGRPYPDVTWYINGRPVQDDATHKILVNESGNHSLMITNVNRFDAGTVTCVARNKAGEIGIEANLTVLEREQLVAPKFVERFTTVNVREGEPVYLNARAIGTPIPRITWQKDGVAMTPNINVSISVNGGETSLDIPRAQASDAGWYQCTAQNIAGSTATRARLFVETPRGPAPEQRRLNLPRPSKVIEPEYVFYLFRIIYDIFALTRFL